MKNVVRYRIIGIFSTVLALLAIVGVVAFIQLGSAERAALAIQQDSLPGLARSGELASTLATDYAFTERHIIHAGLAERRETEALLAANKTQSDAQARAYEATIVDAKIAGTSRRMSACAPLISPRGKTCCAQARRDVTRTPGP